MYGILRATEMRCTGHSINSHERSRMTVANASLSLSHHLCLRGSTTLTTGVARSPRIAVGSNFCFENATNSEVGVIQLVATERIDFAPVDMSVHSRPDKQARLELVSDGHLILACLAVTGETGQLVLIAEGSEMDVVHQFSASAIDLQADSSIQFHGRVQFAAGETHVGAETILVDSLTVNGKG